MRTGTVVVLIMLVAACGEDVSSRAVDRDSASAADSATLRDTAAATRDKSNVQNAGNPEAAIAVVREYYAAIAARDYARAYALWADEGRASGQSFDEFRNGFAQTAAVTVDVGTAGRIEGAAGSRYITIPATVRATTTQGAAQCFRGAYTLRRSEVPGATAERQQWRIHSADMNAQPASECGSSNRAAADRRRVTVDGVRTDRGEWRIAQWR